MKKLALMLVMLAGTSRGVFGMDPNMIIQLPVEMQMAIASSIINYINEQHSVSLFNFQNDEQKIEQVCQTAISEANKNPMTSVVIAQLSEQIAQKGFKTPKTFAEAEALVRAEITKQGVDIPEAKIIKIIDLTKKSLVTLYDFMRPSYFSMSQSYAIVTTAAALAVFAVYKYVYPSKKSRLNHTQD